MTLVHNTLASTYSGGAFINSASGVQAIVLTANLFAGTNGPPKFNSGVASKVTESNNLVTTASNLVAPADLSNPRFWPLAGTLPQTLLSAPADAGYTQEANAPLAIRDIVGSTRRIGALQSEP